MAFAGQKLNETHSTTFDWEVEKWGEISVGQYIKGPEFIVFPDHKYHFGVIKTVQYLSVYVCRSLLDSVSSFHCKVGLIDRDGQERLMERKSVELLPDSKWLRFAQWDINEVNSAISNEDQLILRCLSVTLTVGSESEKHAQTKTSLSATSPNTASNNPPRLEDITDTEESNSAASPNTACNNPPRLEDTTDTEESNSAGRMKCNLNQSTQTEVFNSLETSCTNFLATLSTDLGTLYKEETDTDCALRTVDGQFRVHRAILTARSKVFAAMFHHDTSERTTGEVDIQDVDATILSEVLHFVYTGKVRGLALNNVVRLYSAADKYALHQLRDTCLSFLLNNLEIGNVCDAAILADTHEEVALENRIIHLLVERLDEVIESDEWKTLLSKNPLIASNLLTAALLVKQNAGVKK